jgi:hypothetical protein
MPLNQRCMPGSNLSLVLLSRVSWGTGPFEFDTLRAVSPIQITFPAYEPAFLARVHAPQYSHPLTNPVLKLPFQKSVEIGSKRSSLNLIAYPRLSKRGSMFWGKSITSLSAPAADIGGEPSEGAGRAWPGDFQELPAG